ncbi:hypothetical protein [Burkholderia territorii]|uniref:hypothetical protein n=1 Tax=Burkholderia territorii TaxID=1503055 RepID=UPI0007594564|nr:hypothetical protein [Burkholderia territorii]
MRATRQNEKYDEATKQRSASADGTTHAGIGRARHAGIGVKEDWPLHAHTAQPAVPTTTTGKSLDDTIRTAN